MSKLRLLACFVTAALLGCGTPTGTPDGGLAGLDAPSTTDVRAMDTSVADATTDAMTADVRADVPGDAPSDVRPDASADVATDASCSGAPMNCAMGTPGGACGDVVVPQDCVAGSWVCPAGTILASMCRCIGRPPGPMCTCTATGWSCPGSDAGADAAPDGGVCDTSGIRMVPPGTSFGVGSFCDELYLCARDAAAARMLEAASPSFGCAPETMAGSLACLPGEQRCLYRGGGSTGVRVGASELDQVCRALGIAERPRAGVCLTFI